MFANSATLYGKEAELSQNGTLGYTEFNPDHDVKEPSHRLKVGGGCLCVCVGGGGGGGEG